MKQRIKKGLALLAVILEFLILIMPVALGVTICMDFAHYGCDGLIWDHFRCFIELIKKPFVFLNLDYASLENIISDKAGMVVTIINVVFALFIGIVQRSETKYLGVMIRDINKKADMRYLIIQKEIMIIPILMLISTTVGFCFTAYLLFLYSLSGLYYFSIKYKRSYDWIENQNNLIQILMTHVDAGLDWSSDSYYAYKGLTENVAWSLRQECLWHHTEEFFQIYAERLLESEKNVFQAVYLFFEKVFCEQYTEEKKDVVHIIERYVDSRKYEADTEDGLYDREREIFWGMLYALSRTTAEENVYSMLVWIQDFSKRAERWNIKYETEFPYEKARIQLLYMIIFIEIWLTQTEFAPSDKFVNWLREACNYARRLDLHMKEELYDKIISDCIDAEPEAANYIADTVNAVKGMMSGEKNKFSKIYDLVSDLQKKGD